MKSQKLVQAACFAGMICLASAKVISSVSDGSVDDFKNESKGLRGLASAQKDDLELKTAVKDIGEGITFRLLKKKGEKKATASNSTKAEPQIIGGTTATTGEYPFFTSIIGSSNWLCGASLVAPDFVLTAGHCADAFKKGAIIGAFRQAKMTTGSVKVKVVKQILYPGWKSGSHDDVLLLKISPAVTSIKPIQINLDATLPASGESFEVIGFGLTANNGPASNALRQAEVTEVPYKSCSNYFGGGIVATQHICVENANPYRGTCYGDSGGPLLGLGSGSTAGTTMTYGVLSFGGNSCTKGPSVYTRLSGYTSFLQTNLCRYSASPPSYLSCGRRNNRIRVRGRGSGGSGSRTGGGSSGGGGAGRHHKSKRPKHGKKPNHHH